MRYAARTLWRAPFFTIAATVTLAIGIGVNTAMFAVVYGVLIRPLPYADADRLHMLFQIGHERAPFPAFLRPAAAPRPTCAAPAFLLTSFIPIATR